MADVKSFFQRASIPVPDLTVEGLHATAVALKEAVDVMMGQRGVPEESVVLRRDLILTGIMTNPVYPFTVPPRDDYVPGLGFGDPPIDTGIVYQAPSPVGRWFRIGSLVFFTVVIQLTSKGTATGQAGFSLPYKARPTPNGYYFHAVRMYNTGATADFAMARISPGSDYAMLWETGGHAAPVPVTDGHFTNNTDVGCTGWYEAYVETTDSELLTVTQKHQ